MTLVIDNATVERARSCRHAKMGLYGRGGSRLARAGQFVTGVTDLEVALEGRERCDVYGTNRHGFRWERHAIGGADVIPEQGREYLHQDMTIDWLSLPLLGDIPRNVVPGRETDDQVAWRRRPVCGGGLPPGHRLR